MFKRFFDIVISFTGLIFTSPVFLLVALAIVLEDGGPVFFRQERVGKDGHIFRIHKFRSMRVSGSGLKITSSNDDRITKVGRFIRKSKIDELPQLFDVLFGDMSLVGPRPEVPMYVEKWGDAAAEILSVRPGITDPASIVFRNEQEELAVADNPEEHYLKVILPKKVELYLEYVRTRSFSRDLKIIGQTLKIVATS